MGKAKHTLWAAGEAAGPASTGAPPRHGIAGDLLASRRVSVWIVGRYIRGQDA
jgi:hypothetical protein